MGRSMKTREVSRHESHNREERLIGLGSGGPQSERWREHYGEEVGSDKRSEVGTLGSVLKRKHVWCTYSALYYIHDIA